MRSSILTFLSLSIFLFQTELCLAKAADPKDASSHMALISRLDKPFTGDLEEMRERKTIRALVSHSKTNFFFDKGSPKGFEYEMLNAYDAFLNRDAKALTDRVRIVYIPVPFDKILQYLREGRGDIAAAGITVTPEREKMAAFTTPYLPKVKEVIILNKSVTDVQTLSDLSGKLVYVEKGTSYVQHLKDLNRMLAKEGKKPIRIMLDDNHLVSEDILDLVNADILKITVSEEHTAEAWAGVLENIVVRKDLAINSGGKIAWAVRKNNPEKRKPPGKHTF
jgi:membrane-bound lytic murein transglycosylase MltF